MKITSYTRNTYAVPGTDIEVELPIEPSGTMEYKDPIIRITDDGIVIGYLAHDSDCTNPLEDDDYAGHIYEARRHSQTLRKYEEALALGDFDVEPRNPYAVMLDVYEHSGIWYSLSGTGMQCQFDTARGGAVWVPSEALIEDIKAAADPMARARECAKLDAESYTAWCNGDCYLRVVVTYDSAGQQIDWDTCGGYIGADAAYESLVYEMPNEVPA